MDCGSTMTLMFEVNLLTIGPRAKILTPSLVACLTSAVREPFW